MSTRLVVPTLLIVLLAACGSSSGATSSPGRPATPTPAASTAPAGNGKVDCTALKAAAPQLLMLQLLAQLTTMDNVESIRTKQIGNLDVDAFLAAMHDLHALDG